MAKCKKCGQPMPMVKCQHCGKEFEQNRKDKIYCSSNCKVYAHLKAKREEKKKGKQ